MKTKKYNFSPGPAQLPSEVLARSKKEMWDWYDEGISVMEVSHRSEKFVSLVESNHKKIRQILDIPEEYTLLFIQGGVTMNYYQWCPNLLKENEVANFVISGYWSKMSFREANRFRPQNLAFDNSDTSPLTITDSKGWNIKPSTRFLHYIDNETVDGIEFPDAPKIDGQILVSDMSSNIMTRKFNISDFGLVYSGLQKNVGISGLTLIIVRNDLMQEDACHNHSILYDYHFLREKFCLANTPPNITYYFLSLVLDWIIEHGGVGHFEEQSSIKSKLLYQTIDNSNGFYRSRVDKKYRSRTTIPFFTPSKELDLKLVEYLSQQDLFFLKGHRMRGGLRANIYNSMPLAGVEKLVDAMQAFKKLYG